MNDPERIEEGLALNRALVPTASSRSVSTKGFDHGERNELIEALRPFATAADKCQYPTAGSAQQWLVWEDFERAVAALTKARGEA